MTRLLIFSKIAGSRNAQFIATFIFNATYQGAGLFVRLQRGIERRQSLRFGRFISL